MSDNFLEVEGFSAIGVADLQFARSKAILGAILAHRDYSLVAIGIVQGADDGISKEVLVVDVESDGVPSRNDYGIKYRERIALSVPSNDKAIVEVLALRKDFPNLMHINQRWENQPANLCLYFGPVSETLRTWTPQTFLRRIIWWFVKSSRGELHPADQPVEQLFFFTRYQLVLPWNIDQLNERGEKLTVAGLLERPDGGFTSFLVPVSALIKKDDSTTSLFEITLPPVLHGTVDTYPETLGTLADFLKQRGVDFVGALTDQLKSLFTQAGIHKQLDGKHTVLLLNIPVQRTAESQPEKIHRTAFFIMKGYLALASELGACTLVDNTYYNVPIFGDVEYAAWRANQLFPMEVSRENDKTAARVQSGITEDGPIGTVIGAGSLGSALLNFWGRCGWGQWTVLDKDFIKPHNLSRHIAVLGHIGQMKANAVADIQKVVMGDANPILPVSEDACDFTNPAVINPLKSSSLVVDASTSLEYPRLASTVNEFGRHVSAFLTPSGRSSVLLIEDQHRKVKLRSLEAQYYRGLIRNDWGAEHLVGNKSSFWSGASCRDISFVLPYSRIMLHASILAEQIRLTSSQAAPAIKIWDQDYETGAVLHYSIDVHPERVFDLGKYKVYFDEEVENTMRAIRAAHLPNEAGGVLLGYYDLNLGIVVIVDALPPPPDSKATPHSFERGTQGLSDTIEEILKRTGEIVGYVGEWHSHPDNCPAKPSRDDLYQLTHLAQGMAQDGLPAIQVIVNKTDLTILQGEIQ